MENKPFYEFDLTKEESLSEELERIYESSHNLERYKTVIYRGYDESFTNTGSRKFDSYSEAKKQIDFLINDWETNYSNRHMGQINLCGDSLFWEDYPKIYKWIVNKSLELYGNDIIIKKFEQSNRTSIKKIEIDNPLLTIYSKGCILSEHSDGTPYNPNMDFIKPANLLLYLNKGYKEEWGGCFIVEGKNVVVPEYGKLVFLNFRNGLDPSHRVNKVIEDVNRVALLFNIKYRKSDTQIWNFE